MIAAVWDFFALPLSFPFMQRAMIIAVLVGAVSAVLSCYLVLKGWSLMGDAISHAILPGVVLAYAVGLPLSLGAFAAGLTCAMLTGYVTENSRVREDTVLGIVFSGMFGFGLVLFTRIESNEHLLHILFGNLLGIPDSEFREVVVISIVVLIAVLLRRRDLLVYCFDPQHARAIGLPVRWLHYGLLALLSLAIVASLKAVGLILVIAMLVAPGATAYLLSTRFDRMLLIAGAVAIGSSVAGTLMSFHLDAATGPSIVLLQAGIFAGALLFARMRRSFTAPEARAEAGPLHSA